MVKEALMNKLRKLWHSMDEMYRLFILVICLELSIYLVADFAEWLVGVLL